LHFDTDFKKLWFETKIIFFEFLIHFIIQQFSKMEGSPKNGKFPKCGKFPKQGGFSKTWKVFRNGTVKK
jgi:hypothetical protein